jgi:hypothetical protein
MIFLGFIHITGYFFRAITKHKFTWYVGDICVVVLYRGVSRKKWTNMANYLLHHKQY